MFAIRPRGFREAIARALANEDREFAETRWSDALSAAGLGRGALRRRAPREAPRRLPLDRRFGLSGARVPPDSQDRRRDGLVLRRLALAAARLDRPARGGVGLRRGRRDPEGRRPARPSTSGASRRRAGPAAPPGRRDEASRSGLAAVRGRRRRRPEHDSPDGDLPPDRPPRHGVLVRPVPGSRGCSAACCAASAERRWPRTDVRLPQVREHREHAAVVAGVGRQAQLRRRCS